MEVDLTVSQLLCVLAFGSLVVVMIRCQTVLLGFTIFSFFNIATASLSGLIFASMFRLETFWITAEHIQVFNYTALGLIAFCCGVLTAWHPLWWKRRISRSGLPQNIERTLSWMNPRIAFFCIILSVIAQLLVPVAYSIPTLRTVWSTYLDLLRVGMLIALVYSRTTRDYRPFAICTVVFLPSVLLQAVMSGHIQAGGTFLLQLLLIGCFWNRSMTPRSLAVCAVGMNLVLLIAVGWLDSRYLIRRGELDYLPPIERAVAFTSQFRLMNPLSSDTQHVQDAILERIDMSRTLAHQVEHQPRYEPYAYGETISSGLIGALVPRFLWPEKPDIAGGSEFVSRYSGESYAEGTSVGVPCQFEMYANGGAVGVIMGMLVLGWLTAKLELSLFNPQHSLSKFLGLISVVQVVSNGAQTVVLSIVSAVVGYYSLLYLGKHIERHFMTSGTRRTSRRGRRVVGRPIYRAKELQ